MPEKKAVLFIVDGLGGRPTDMDGETCLEAAETPNLDGMASGGINGLLHTVKRGVKPGSDVAHLSILSYDPEEGYTGRGVFEALGYGMDATKGNIYFRTNFATVDGDVVQDRRAGRINEGQKELEEAINSIDLEDAEFNFKATNQHRGALELVGDNLSPHITDTDPHESGEKMKSCEPVTSSKEAEKTAEIVNQFIEKSREVMEDLDINDRRKEDGEPPANCLLLRGASHMMDVETLEGKYDVESTCVAAGPLYLGVAKQVGMDVRTPDGATGGVDSDLIAKAKTAVSEVDEKDFVFIHAKGADNAGHDHDAEGKKKFLEKVDEAVGYLLDKLDWNRTHMVFTGDHTTPVGYGNHTAEPVPVVFYGSEVRTDSVEEIGERSCARGDLGHMEGLELLPVLFNYNDWTEKYGS
ncbi:MAG: 2,3-bisphosphoglycerate-independent phosphoglycerate mutase [Candidatus Aenigmatarchaeota archaeon]